MLSIEAKKQCRWGGEGGPCKAHQGDTAEINLGMEGLVVEWSLVWSEDNEMTFGCLASLVITDPSQSQNTPNPNPYISHPSPFRAIPFIDLVFNKWTGTQTDRQTDRQTERQKDRKNPPPAL